jgi:hypothetical protein
MERFGGMQSYLKSLETSKGIISIELYKLQALNFRQPEAFFNIRPKIS